MGTVYVVEQTSTHKERALKVMQPQLLADAKMRERFVREAQIASSIPSEHVVEVVDAGIDGEIPWIAMELLQGETLAALLARRGHLDAKTVRQIFAQLCHAVGAAHALSPPVVHRDLKPENIFLAASRREGASFDVKVLDFGIAKIASEAQTRSTAAMGTPYFMPPEQMVPGKSIAPASDVWALGLLAFRVLTGRHFWKTAEAEASNPVMLVNEVSSLPIPAASERARELGVEDRLPRDFDSWFARCVMRDPASRFRDATAARAALEPLLGRGTATETWSIDEDPNDRAPVVRTELMAKPPDFGRTDAQRAQRRKSPTVLIVAIAALVGATASGAYMLGRSRSTSAPSTSSSASASAPPSSSPSEVVAIASSPAPIVPSKPNAPPPSGCPTGTAGIPGGSFVLGANKKTAEVKPFCLDLTEVTVSAFAACAAQGKCTPAQTSSTENGHPKDTSSCNGSRPERGAHPVNCIDFMQAEAFCKSRGARLPTEEEWEWAARGGENGTRFPWGNEPPGSRICWDGEGNDVGKGNRRGTCAVGSFPTGDNPWGVHDLSGNLWEWTSSTLGAGTLERVTRGGGWFDFDVPAYFEATSRMGDDPTLRSISIGFRCARSLP